MLVKRTAVQCSATAITGLALGLLLGCGGSTEAGGSLPSSLETRSTGTQSVVVDDLAARVPAEWRRQTGGTHGLYMVDPRHASNAVSFSIFSSPLGSNWGLMNEASGAFHELRTNPTYSHATIRNVHLPGVHAFEFTFQAKLDSGRFLGRKYVVVHRGRIYWITYEWSSQQTSAHLPQIDASANSLRYGRGPYDPDIRTVVVTRSPAGVLTFRILFRHPTKLSGVHKLEVFLDTDLNAKTGARGAEYVLDYSKSSADLGSWRTKKFSTPRSLRFTATPRSATFRISSDALGDPAGFGFFVYVARGDALLDQVPLTGIHEAEWTYPAGSSKVVRHTSR